MNLKKTFSIPTLKRMPAYLRELRRLYAEGNVRVSSPYLANLLRVDAITARKDLEILGVAGRTGVGYPTEQLITAIETLLGWNNTSEVFLAGVTEVGRALLGYRGFDDHNLKIIAAFDRNAEEIESEIHDVPVFPFAELNHLTRRLKIRMAILCVPEPEAQETAEQLVDAGIQAIWNFTRQTLHLPDSVIVQRVNLAGDLAVLSVKLQEKLKQDPDYWPGK